MSTNFKVFTDSNGKFLRKEGTEEIKFYYPIIFPAYYTLPTDMSKITIKLPSLDLIDIRWRPQDQDAQQGSGGFLEVSADFSMAIVYQGTHWGSYACYGNHAPVYIYKLPDQYMTKNWWIEGNGEENGLAIIANLEPIGAIIRDNSGLLKVMTPAQAVNSYGGSY